MTLVVGTGDGVYRVETVPFDDAEAVLDCGRTPTVDSFEGIEGVFAATVSGLYRSLDDGCTWEQVDLPGPDNAWEIAATSDGRLYAGTQPAHLYESLDGGENWTEVESVRRHTTVDLWRSAYSPDAHVRTVEVHPDTPERVFAGVEAGGLYRSEDGCETWSKCELRDEAGVVQDDIHELVAITPEEYVVACGRLSIHDPNHAAAEGGLYHTDDAGGSWTRLDRDLGPSYYRTVVHHRGVLYTCGALTVPPEWASLGAEATMYASEDVGRSFEAVAYPGGPDEIVLDFEADGDRLLGGTDVGERGRVISLTPGGEWRTAGSVPESVHSLHVT